MASGFDTGVATGLLGSINAQNAEREKEQERGDAAQYASFQEAAHEYDKSKAKVSADTSKIDALANVLSGGKPNAAAYATARDAVELGYTGTEHLPYVQDAYQHTLKSMQDNPEQWNGHADAGGPDKNKPNAEVDTNPDQTQVYRKFGDRTPVAGIENIRQNSVQKPYSNLPGAQWGNAQEFQSASEAAKVGAKATADLNAQKANLAQYGFGDNNNQTAAGGAPPAQTQPQPGQPNTAQVPAAPAPPAATASTDVQNISPQMGSAQSQYAVPEAQLKPNASTNVNTPSPAATPSPQQSQPATNDFTAPTEPQPTVSLRNEDALKAVSEPQARILRAMSDGTAQIPNATARSRDKTGLLEKQYELLRMYDSTADENRFGALKTFLGGKNGDQIAALNTAIGHLGVLDQAKDALQNGNVQILNKMANYYKVQIGRDAQTTYNTVLQRLAQELTRAYRGAGGTEQDIAETEKNLGSALSPQQATQALGTQVQLLKSMMDGKENQYRIIKGNAYQPHTYLSPAAQKVFDRIDSETSQSSDKNNTQQKPNSAASGVGTYKGQQLHQDENGRLYYESQ